MILAATTSALLILGLIIAIILISMLGLTTYRGTGSRIPKTVPTGGGVVGDVYVIVSGASGFCGIWLKTYSAGDAGILQVDGEHELAAVNNAAFTLGALLYWDDSANKLTTTATGNTRIGRCVAAKATTGTTARVKLGQF